MGKMVEFIKNKFAKLFLIVLSVAILVFQAVVLSIKPTNAEVVERVKQSQLLATLNLGKNNAGEYIIASAYNFAALGDYCKNGGSTLNMSFRQTVDIDFSSTHSTGVYPIGTSSSKFKGKYYGDNHIISNFKVYSNWGNYDVGLFGYVDGGEITNIILNDSNIIGKNGYSAGGIAGSIYNDALISDCTVINCNINSTVSTNANSGGIVGYIDSTTAVVRRCFSNATVEAYGTGTIRCGGIAGVCEGEAYIDRCEVRGSITAGDSNATQAYAGGIVGYARYIGIEDCNVYKCTIKAKSKHQTSSSTSSSTSTDPDGYLAVTKTTTTSISEYKSYSGGIAGYAYGAAISETLIQSSRISGGYKKSTDTYRYATNSFAGIRAERTLFPIYFAYDYTYYNFSFNLSVYPETVKTYSNYLVGNSENVDYYNNNYYYNTSVDRVSIESASAAILDFAGKTHEVSKNYDRPSDTTTTIGTTSLSIGMLPSSYAAPFWNKNNEVYMISQPLFYYCTNGTTTTVFQGQTATGTIKNVFEMIFKWTYQTIDEDGLDELSRGEGYKLTLTWDFAYGWQKANETYTYTDTPMSGGNYYTSKGAIASEYSSSYYSSKLSSLYWSVDSSIHEGYPYLQYFYWQDSANIDKPG